jgi:hypothetical protein
LALTFWLAVHTASLKAQILGPYGTSPTIFEVDANGLLSDTGTFGTGTLSLSGSGTRMFWYPGKAAFRAGYVNGTEWNDANIGAYSVAFGYGTTASGAYSSASGYETVASGGGSTASGYYSEATGSCATAMGDGVHAFSDNSTASGAYTTAWAWAATAMGGWTTASGGSSLATGVWTTASGGESATFGKGTTASAYDSIASGVNTTASGYCSMSAGYSTIAPAQLSFVIGTYNVGLNSAGGAANPTTWEATDPLFEIGDGTSSTPSDAFVVYKNGNAVLQGTLQVAPGGDIPMYTGE